MVPEEMSQLADLFPGFASHWIDTQAGKIFARAHGVGPLCFVHFNLVALFGEGERHQTPHESGAQHHTAQRAHA